MIVTHISMSIPSRRHREASWACSRPNASTCLVVGRPMVRERREKITPVYRFHLSGNHHSVPKWTALIDEAGRMVECQ
jgi:hypothetical protein